MNTFDQRRRQVLRGTLALCALATASLFGCGKRETPPPEAAPPATSPVKVTQASVQYQLQPKGEQMCSNCMQFVEPNACKVVEGNISPQGWCMLWAKEV